MRMDPRYTRVRKLLTAPEVPRFSGGGIALCHACQRQVYWSKGLLPLLAEDLRKNATKALVNGSQDNCLKCGHGTFYEITSRNRRKCRQCGHQRNTAGLSRPASAKMSDEKRAALMEALGVMSIRQAAIKVGVNYHTAWRHAKMEGL